MSGKEESTHFPLCWLTVNIMEMEKENKLQNITWFLRQDIVDILQVTTSSGLEKLLA